MTAPLDAEHLALARPGSAVQVVLQVTAVPERGVLDCILLEPAEAGSGPRSFHASGTRVEARWSDATRVAMGGPDDLTTGALLRVLGELQQQGHVIADAIAVLTAVATVVASG
jgi:hypothetical protein